MIEGLFANFEERDCEHCVHHVDDHCESWFCTFERRGAEREEWDGK